MENSIAFIDRPNSWNFLLPLSRLVVPEFGSPTKAEYNAPSNQSAACLRVSARFHEGDRKFDVPALMLHELEPGHHLQVLKLCFVVFM